MNNLFEIKFDTKFTQKDIDFYIKNYFNATLEKDYSEIIFDLERLEWISAEEITFLFAWLRKLHLLGGNIKIKLPLPAKRFADDDEEIVGRREFIRFYLWKVWGMFSLEINDNEFWNLDGINPSISKREGFNFGKKILPFQIIETDFNPQEAVDERFYINTKGHFDLSKEIIDLLNTNNCYSPFENKVISEIITKELFMNSAEHAKTQESYFTTALRDRWKTRTDNPNFINQFLLEKDSCTLNFYKDKSVLKEIIKNESLKIDPQKIKGKRIADLSKKAEYNIFKNQSFIEFTFIDFGEGIHSTLKEAYSKSKEKSRQQLSSNIDDNHLDSQVLEYSFLLDSSKDPFDGRIERTDLIPRGLYFLIDMVRRYKGLLVARSGYGKVVYDFSDRIIIENKKGKLTVDKERIYVAKDAVIPIIDENVFFQGTIISIILPERQNEQFRKAPVRIDDLELNRYLFNRDNGIDEPIELFKPESYQYLDFSFLYKVSESNIYAELYNAPKGVINAIFIAINKKLKELNEIGTSCVLFIDFEYLPRHNYLYKILIYLSNSPLVNERIKLIAINLDVIDLGILKKEYGIGNEDRAPFLFKAIPCLRLDKSSDSEIKIIGTQWIGIENKEDCKFFTELFEGKRDSIPASWITNQYLCEGNIIAKYQDRVISLLDFQELQREIKNAKLNNIWEWIKTDVIKDGEKITTKHSGKTLYLTSQGTYQTKYLSFYEPLNFKFTAEYFAQYLLGKYIETMIADFEMKTGLNFDQLDEKYRTFIKRSFKFDKILAVTVSSQLLAVEIRNLIRNNKDSYIYLISDNNEAIGKCFNLFNQLLDQFNYGSSQLEEEKPQIKILDFFKANQSSIDRYYSTYQTICKEETVELKLCPELIQLSSYFSFEEERPYQRIKENQRILIVNDVISTGKLIEKLINGIKDKKAMISGVLSITDARRKNVDETEESKSYFPEEEGNNNIKVISIISSERNKDFVIKKLIKKPEGFARIKRINPILNAIVTLQTKHAEKNKILFGDLQEFLKGIYIDELFKIGHFKQNLSCSGYFIDMHALFYGEKGRSVLHILKGKMKIKFEESNKNYENPYFIFHPIHCGIEEVTEEVYREVFNTNVANIATLQRYETPYGWRFAFPPKRFNKMLQGKNILIIDSGSLSGQSLVQLIDAVSIYEVNRIDVLCVIGRLEDFHREFYSKLQHMSVKVLQDINPPKNNKITAELNVFFGIDLHIPSYHSEDICPFCKEKGILMKYKSNPSLPPEAVKYIDERMKEVSQKDTPDYIPRKKNGRFDFIEIFKMRDELGKIDGYRFYEDYFYTDDNKFSFDKLCEDYSWENVDKLLDEKENLKNFELILICILHEPYLIGSIKNLLRNVYDVEFALITMILSDASLISQLNYNWSKYSLLRIYYTFITESQFYKYEVFEKVFRFCSEDTTSLNFVSFLLAKEAFHLDPTRKPFHIFEILEHLHTKVSNEKGCLARTIINYLRINYNLVENIETVRDAFETLHVFFAKQHSSGGHFSLLEKCTILDMARSNPIGDDKQYEHYIETLKYIVFELKNNIYDSLLKIKNYPQLKNCFDIIEYNRLFKDTKCVFKDLKKIIEEFQKFDTDIAKRNNEADEKLKIFAEKLYDFRIDYIINDKEYSFLQYCNNQISNIKETFKEEYKILECNGSKLSIKFDEDNLDRMINLHKSFLNKLIHEILKNAITFANQQDTNKDVILEIYTKSLVDGCCYDLIFEQSTPFSNPKNIKRGTYHTIQTILDTFFEDQFEIVDEPKYIIKVKNNLNK